MFIHDIGRCEPCQIKKNESVARRRERDGKRANRYYQEHKEELAEKKKEYRKIYNKIDVECEVCKCTVRKCGWVKHTLADKHKNNLENFVESFLGYV